MIYLTALKLRSRFDGSGRLRAKMFAAGRSFGEWGWHLFLSGLALLIVWAPPRFLTQDGPAHLYTSRVFYELLRMQGLSECFRIAVPPPPNSLCTWLGAVLIAAAGPALTEKVWAALYVMLVTTGAICLARSFPQNSSLGVYLFILNPFLFAGFWNFNLALGIWLVGLAVLEGVKKTPRWYAPVVIVCLGIVLYLSHLFVFAAFLPATYLALLAGTIEFSRHRMLLRIICVATLLLAPAGAVLFLWRQMLPFRIGASQIGITEIWRQLAGISPLSLNAWYRYGEQYLLLLIGGAVLVCFTGRAWRQRNFSMLALLAIFLLFFLLVPDQLGVTMAIKGRLWLVIVCVAALWLPSRWNHAIGAICALLLLWHAWNVLPRQVEWNQAVTQLLETASRMESEQTQASLMGIYWGRSRVAAEVIPLLHADLLLAERTRGVSLSSNQLQSQAFAVAYRGRCQESADNLSALAMQETRSAPMITDTVRAAGVRYLILWKAGTLPWVELLQNPAWNVLHQTTQFVVVDTGVK